MDDQRIPAAQRAYAHTKDLLLTGRAEPGRMLSEGEIATAIGVSRTPVREAFTQLQSEGWLRLYPRRGALVVPPDPTQARDLVSARILLETASLDAAVQQPEETRTETIDRLVGQLKASLGEQQAALDAQDLAAFTESDLAFHRAIIETGNNTILLRFHDLVADQERRMSIHSLWRSPEALRRALSQHEQLVDAIRAADVTGFRDTLHGHLLDIHARLVT